MWRDVVRNPICVREVTADLSRRRQDRGVYVAGSSLPCRQRPDVVVNSIVSSVSPGRRACSTGLLWRVQCHPSLVGFSCQYSSSLDPERGNVPSHPHFVFRSPVLLTCIFSSAARSCAFLISSGNTRLSRLHCNLLLPFAFRPFPRSSSYRS